MKREINFDMDGTIVDLYGVKNWLPDLKKHKATPYIKAKPLIDCHMLSEQINALQAKGYKVNIISWLSKDSNTKFDRKVTKAKIKWLKKYLPTVKFDNINIVSYGIPKSNYGKDILFDDELSNRKEWKGIALDEKDILYNLSIL